MTDTIKRRISDFCTLKTGGTPSTSIKSYYEGGTVPWLVSGDIHKGIITNSEKFITTKGVENSNARYLPSNSVLIALNGQGKTRGTVALLRMENATCNQSLVAISPNDSVAIPEYLYYNLRYRYAEIRAMTGDNERSGLSITKVGSIIVPLPPLPEQRRIAAEVERQLAAVEKAKQAAAEQVITASEIGRLILNQTFVNSGWDIVRLGDIGDFCMCKRIYKDQTKPKGDIPFYKIGTFGGKADAYISNDLYEEYKRKFSFPRKGQVLISASGTIGRSVVYDGTPSYFQDSNIVWLDHDESKVLNSYLSLWYATNPWVAVEGSTISRLYGDNVREAQLPLPPILKQRQIVEQVDSQLQKAGRTVAVLQAQYDTITAMPAAILRQAFSGKI